MDSEITLPKGKLLITKSSRMEAEVWKSELEALLSTNLVRQQLESEMQLSANDPMTVAAELQQEEQNLKEAKVFFQSTC